MLINPGFRWAWYSQPSATMTPCAVVTQDCHWVVPDRGHIGDSAGTGHQLQSLPVQVQSEDTQRVVRLKKERGPWRS
jgi:hypothetical protein